MNFRTTKRTQDEGKRDIKGLIKTMGYKKIRRTEGTIYTDPKMEDLGESLRMTAAFGLGETVDIRAVEPFVAVLQRDDHESYAVRGAAAYAPGKIGGARAGEALITLVSD